jgi:hypothetical protein
VAWRPGPGLVALLVTILGSTPARAQEPAPAAPREAAPPEADTPWSKGVPPEKRAEALRHFKDGNDYFERSQYPQALARYQEALRSWDHPAIRFNQAQCLVNLDRVLEAHEAIQAALRFGKGPLDEKYREAQMIHRLLEGRVARLKVTCTQPGVTVTLDGKPLLAGPGVVQRIVLPGDHQVVASKPGFVTVTRTLNLPSGRETGLSLTLLPFKASVKLVRRWPKWKPWVIFGAGAVAAVVGVPLILQAKSDYASYDSDIKRLCSDGDGCTQAELPSSVTQTKSRARAENVTAIVMFAAGGAVLAAGATMLILNIPRVQRQRERSAAPVSVLPSLGPGGAGLLATWEF